MPASSAGISAFPQLERCKDTASRTFSTPSKRINDGDDLHFFFTSTAYRDLTAWLLQLTRAMFPARLVDGTVLSCSLESPPPLSSSVQGLRDLLRGLSDLVEDAPPHTGPRRFGNVAFRDWYRLAEDSAAPLLQKHLDSVLPLAPDGDNKYAGTLRGELRAYLLGSFGSAQRLDYGTGHELSFLAFLGCLWKLGTFEAGEEQSIVIGVWQPYLELVRKLIATYTLEPAGSHGVWGLDDHSFLPYIFGSAQLGPAISDAEYPGVLPTEGSLPTAPSPASVIDRTVVANYKNSNLYFSAVQFIYDVKRGPFWEHSPVLYDISGIKDGWGKINKGMLKMYAAEVLGKFPVVQHFPFGSLFCWEKDAAANEAAASMHAHQQPPAMQPKYVLSAASTSTGTAAPWTKSSRTVMPPMQANSGMPSSRAPWSAGSRRSAPLPSSKPDIGAMLSSRAARAVDRSNEEPSMTSTTAKTQES